MQTFELTQKILSIGPTYEVRSIDPTLGTGAPLPELTIKGKVLTASPKLSINVGGADGPLLGSMKGNFTRTKFECRDLNDDVVGAVSFPMLALKKSFTLETGGREYKADGGFLGGEFLCKDAEGTVVLKITKELSLRDKFRIEADAAIPTPLALLAAVAIDQRFFQEN